MKKMMGIFLITGLFFSCKAQVLPPEEQIISLRDQDGTPLVENAYYKDVENDFQPLIGTWKYTNGNELFKITIKKKAHRYATGFKNYYEDVIYGEYKYIDANGTVLINSLGDINNSNMQAYEHLI